MIREDTVDGRPAMLAFFDDNFETCEEDVATLIKIIFLDEENGNMFVSAQQFRGEEEEGGLPPVPAET